MNSHALQLNSTQHSTGTRAKAPGSATAPVVGDDEDVALLKRVAEHRDSTAMERLYHSYRPRLGAFVFRLVQDDALCEEIYNDVMLAVWRKASDFKGESKVSTWVFAIAYRQGLSRLRSRREFVPLDESTFDEGYGCDQLEHQDVLGKALLALSPEHRMAVELAYYVGLNYQEIAEVAGCPASTVKTRIFYARRKMREQIEIIGRPTGGPGE